MTPIAALLAVLVVAGCGGDGGGAGGAADVVPADALVYVSLDTDFESDQWQQAERLAGRFPDAIDDLMNELAEEDVDLERDVKPAVGPEVGIVVLAPAAAGTEPQAAFLTQPDDPAKLDELLEKSDEEYAKADVDGWTVVAENEAAIDAIRDGEGSLSEEDEFEEAMGELPEDALARVFVDGEAAARLAQSEGETSPEERAALDCFAGDGAGTGAFALSAEDAGIRVVGHVEAGEVDAPDDAESRLAAELPDGALAFVSIQGLGEQARRILRCISDSNEEAARQIAAAELGLGLSIEEDILPLFAGETAVAVYGAGAEPSIVVATEVEDEAAARRTLDRIAERASAFLGGFPVDEIEIAGADARRVRLGDGTEIFWTVADGTLLAASTEEGIEDAVTGDGSLAVDGDYAAAREAAGAAEEANALVYANLEALVTLAGMADDSESDELAKLEPLRSFFLWSETDGDAFSFEGLLQID